MEMVALVASRRIKQFRSTAFYLQKAGPGFTLPEDIGKLSPGIRELNLTGCSLTGRVSDRQLEPCHQRAESRGDAD